MYLFFAHKYFHTLTLCHIHTIYLENVYTIHYLYTQYNKYNYEVKIYPLLTNLNKKLCDILIKRKKSILPSLYYYNSTHIIVLIKCADSNYSYYILITTNLSPAKIRQPLCSSHYG